MNRPALLLHQRPQTLSHQLPGTPPNVQRAHYFFAPDNVPDFTGSHMAGYPHVIETGPYRHLFPLLSFIQRESPVVSLCLSTRTAFQRPASELCMHLMQRNFSFPEHTHDALKTCLQESIMNAIIHGNLGIQPCDSTPPNFQAYYDKVTQTLQNQAHAEKRVSIFIWRGKFSTTAAIFDQGDCDKLAEKSLKTHGRGMLLIRNFAHTLWQTQPNNLFMEIRD